MWAHDPGLSSLSLRRFEEHLRVTATFAPADLAWLAPLNVDNDGFLSQAEFRSRQAQLHRLVPRLVQIREPARTLRLLGSETLRIQLPGNDNVRFELDFELPLSSRLRVTAGLLQDLPKGHRQLVDWISATGEPLAEALLSSTHYSVWLDGSQTEPVGSHFQSGSQFLLLGIEHIWTGYDHLLFLVGLLVVSWRLMPAIRIITAFTVAHSLALALAAFEVVRLPTSLVEPLIALSVVYVGIENLRRGEPEYHWALPLGFGLIHGLGFAGGLQGLLNEHSAGLLVPLFSFNLGVELGQLAVASAVLPLLSLLSRRRSWLAVASASVSVGLILAGCFWLFERISV